ncbi:hypothetical protein [Mucilaginibacter defluvii]|uniref:SH3 domain-containing protein n=1 Tax=Mucilaginibacter defluvii TaxID=1196019 RepID=A0ABP9FW83_9SPHI
MLVCSTSLFGQTGTYQKKIDNGAYGAVSFQRKGNRVNAEIFTWWNTHNAQMGYYSGSGILQGNVCVLRSDENDPGCNVTLTVVDEKIEAKFSGCATDHLTEDFNGLYTKFTDAVPGEYVVTIPKAYFYRKPDAGTKLKAYVLKGDKVTLDMDRITASKGNWLYVYFTGKNGKDTAGYMKLSDLKKADSF